MKRYFVCCTKHKTPTIESEVSYSFSLKANERHPNPHPITKVRQYHIPQLLHLATIQSHWLKAIQSGEYEEKAIEEVSRFWSNALNRLDKSCQEWKQDFGEVVEYVIEGVMRSLSSRGYTFAVLDVMQHEYEAACAKLGKLPATQTVSFSVEDYDEQTLADKVAALIRQQETHTPFRLGVILNPQLSSVGLNYLDQVISVLFGEGKPIYHPISLVFGTKNMIELTLNKTTS